MHGVCDSPSLIPPNLRMHDAVDSICTGLKHLKGRNKFRVELEGPTPSVTTIECGMKQPI